VDLLLGYVELLQIRNRVAGVEEEGVGVSWLRARVPVLGQKNFVAEAGVDELLNLSRAGLPWNLGERCNVVGLAHRWLSRSVKYVVDADGVSAFGESDEVGHVVGVIAVA